MPFKTSLNLRILMQLQIGTYITNFISSFYCRGAGISQISYGLALIFQTDKVEATYLAIILKTLPFTKGLVFQKYVPVSLHSIHEQNYCPVTSYYYYVFKKGYKF